MGRRRAEEKKKSKKRRQKKKKNTKKKKSKKNKKAARTHLHTNAATRVTTRCCSQAGHARHGATKGPAIRVDPTASHPPTQPASRPIRPTHPDPPVLPTEFTTD